MISQSVRGAVSLRFFVRGASVTGRLPLKCLPEMETEVPGGCACALGSRCTSAREESRGCVDPSSRFSSRLTVFSRNTTLAYGSTEAVRVGSVVGRAPVA